MEHKPRKLVIFTAHYPYTEGESFLEEEMRYAAEHFREIVIVTAQRVPTEDRYFVPEQAAVIEYRKGQGKLAGLPGAFARLLLPGTLRELYRGIRERGVRKIPLILNRLILTERNIVCLQKTRGQWMGGEDTLYYAYWLGAEAICLARLRRELKGICIARAHGQDCFFHRDYHPYRRLQLEKLDGIYPISHAGREDLLEHYAPVVPALAEKVKPLPLGVLLPDGVNPWARREEMTIVSCAEVKQLKRVDLLIDALALLEMPVRWVHFGDGAQMGQITAYAAARLGGKPNIRYRFTGRIPKGEILDFYEENSVDLFVNTSDREGIPVSVMEAMAYGIPVMARRVGGNAELVDPGCGVLLPEQVTPAQLAQAIREIRSLSPQQRGEMGQTARQRIDRGFSAEKNCQALYGQFL